jgi:hypothetical protein
MPIRFACPSCKKTLNAPHDKTGVRVSCPGCKQPLVIPGPDEPILEVLTVEKKGAPKKGPPPLPEGPADLATTPNPQHAGADSDGKGVSIKEVMNRIDEQEDRERVPRIRSWMREQVAAANWTQAYRFARCLLYSVPDDPEALEVKARVEREFPTAVPDKRLVFRLMDVAGIRKVVVTCECGIKTGFPLDKIGHEVRCCDCRKPFILLRPDGQGNDPPPTSQVTSTSTSPNPAPATSPSPASTLRPVVGLFARLKEGLQSQQKRVEGLAKGVQQALQDKTKGVQQSIEEQVRAVAGLVTPQGSTPTVQPSELPNREDKQPSGPLPSSRTTPVEADSSSAHGGPLSIADRLRQAKEQAAREKLANLKRTLNRQVEDFNLKEAYRTARHILNLVPNDDEAIGVKKQIESQYSESVPDDQMKYVASEYNGKKVAGVLCECGHKLDFPWDHMGS